ncbi:D-hexose-6-phosphate mutarotase [Pseudoalteromonas sp. McH1-7]|uniref:D-hexose-6-phosphate mutarotase n=1 Tax=Pseudoalteromonas TaxID=53246 RepID=UPI000F652FC3|nr:MULTISPECIES: D-hexose-6-phosphate mutarotase [Pseudoalteromonas]MDW7551217.1 D-hexose-6-phosphate mutarotase [Pseudoalteromonas peptidolytica]NUZ12320.1 D-hexose-6-phosphate mutarotase [Pseudoalteromonas sp. McH1-7]RRS10356.1 D-hexose-6-phosphate mutarotase [Pseudoalteromonas sp. J010]USD28403.1 D-hexose-6-phosphate mutarotase [Pseudoalteromonas sp. SCSIO 43201]
MELSPSVSIERTESGLEYIWVDSALCQAKIFLQGAQLTEFTPAGKGNLIWVSEAEDYLEGKPIRGGIPICWPWFGVHSQAEWPIHGVARKLVWRADSVIENDNEIIVKLTLPMTLVEAQYWPHQSTLAVEFVLSDKLAVRLTNTNTGDVPFTLTQALHTYFPTPEIGSTTVDGLQGAKYIEFGEGPYEQNEIVSFARETDMVYTQAGAVQTINTPAGIIEVKREQSSSCVLWNPWIEKSQRLSNFNDEEYHNMLCLEAANVMDDAVQLAPGESHTLGTVLRWL